MSNSYEELLLKSGRLNQTEINEIRQLFIMIDTDKSGNLSYDEVAKVMQDLCKSE